MYCGYPVTLGGSFLRASETLKRFATRLVRKARTYQIPHVCYQGSSQLCVKGYCGGQGVLALPETCSDVRILSRQMVHALGANMKTEEEYRIHLQLLGGSIVRTLGMVQDVE